MIPYPLPRPVDELFGLADCMLKGLKLHGDALDLPTDFSPPALAAVLEQARRADQALKKERLRRRAEILPPLARADETGKALIKAARLVLQHHLGKRWGRKWTEIGWQNRKASTPRTLPKREALLAALLRHFLSHPNQESLKLGVTIQQLRDCCRALQQARLEAEQLELALLRLSKQRRTALAALRKIIRGVIDALTEVLPEDASAWDSFGLNPPSHYEVPSPPCFLRLCPLPGENGTGKLQIIWSESARAEYYYVYRRTRETGNCFQFVDLVRGTNLTMNDLPLATPIQIRIVAANPWGLGLGVEGEVALR